MTLTPPAIDDVIPAEYRAVAGALFAGPGSADDAERAALAFASLIGVADDYAQVVSADAEGRARAERRLLGHFRNNVELLAQKTWVEKADEAVKEKLLDRVPVISGDLEKGDYSKALRTLSHIVDELAYLLFGSQSRKGDFIEYAFRIDSALGLFLWYSGKLPLLNAETDQRRLRAMIYLGVCFLADF